MSGEDFSWRDAQDCVAVGEQLAIATYPNPKGDIVIRQEDRWGDDDDVVIIARNNVAAVCRALMEAAGLEMQQPTVTLLPPKSSGAERSRRYRRRHAQRDDGRDADRDDDGVTRGERRDDSDAHGDGELPLRDAAE